MAQEESWHLTGPIGVIGLVLGVIGWVATFVGIYIAAVASTGWVIGIALGWIPAGIAATLAFALIRHAWFFCLLLAIFAAAMHFLS